MNTAWFARAACRNTDTNIFFPSHDTGDVKEVHRQVATAKAICAQCPVRLQCLEYGASERYGIFGGLSEKERRLWRERRVA